MKTSGYYVIAFIEGASLMAFQLITSRILAAGFGVTLDVWAVLLSFTLLGLAIGYFTGGKWTQKQHPRLLFYILGISALLMLSLPFYQKIMIQASLQIADLAGLLFFGLIAVAPAVFLFGLITPLVIEKQSADQKGATAGKMYSVSTLGGIIGTFLFGLHFIPSLGVFASSMILGTALVVSSAIAFLNSKN